MARVVVTTVFLSGCAVALSLLPCCQHYESELPGVLDLRSDGAEAPVESRPLPREAAREGLEAWMKGQGVTGATDIVAEDRAVWALRLFLLGDGLAPEVQAALGKGGALRKVALQEELTLLDAAFFFCAMPIPCVDLAALTLLPSFTVQLTGTRVLPSGLPATREGPTAPPVGPAGELAPETSPGAAPAPEPTPALDRPATSRGSAP
ncbi:MAG: hypothetical protein IT382_20775 [Deltaproteobacteria bacterium]|nr:hypothetical protein [Deltaproteobacteria bacterium]